MLQVIDVVNQSLADHGLDLDSGWVQDHIDAEYYRYLLTRGTHDFTARGSDTLLITIGDSWTHGSWAHHDVDGDWTRATTEDYRRQHCFGQQISQAQGWDFVNLSLPAANNQWMALVYQCVCGMADLLPYQQIKVIMTLTEYGRELVCPTWRRRVGLHAFSGIDIVQPTADTGDLAQYLTSATTIQDLFRALSQQVAHTVLKAQHPKVSVIMATNYVSADLYPESLSGQFMAHSWLETLLGQPLDDSAWVLGGIVVPWLKSWAQPSATLMQELLAIMHRAQQRQDLIYATGLNRSQGYGHPNKKGHELWARYLLSNAGLKA